MLDIESPIVNTLFYRERAANPMIALECNNAATAIGYAFLSSPDSYLLTIDSAYTNGDGMTRLLWFLCDKVIARGEQILLVSAERCSWYLEDSFVYQMLVEQPWLFIDDVCFMYRAPQRAKLWHQILQARIEHKRKTLCTLAAWSGAELKRHIAPEQYDLIYSGMHSHILRLTLADKVTMARYWLDKAGVSLNNLEELSKDFDNIREAEQYFTCFLARLHLNERFEQSENHQLICKQVFQELRQRYSEGAEF